MSIETGDVVILDGIHYVNLGIVQNREHAGSMTYDRTYALFYMHELLALEEQPSTMSFDEKNVVYKNCGGTDLPFRKDDNFIPYNVAHKRTVVTYTDAPKQEWSSYIINIKEGRVVYE